MRQILYQVVLLTVYLYCILCTSIHVSAFAFLLVAPNRHNWRKHGGGSDLSIAANELVAIQKSYADLGWVKLRSVISDQKLAQLQKAADSFELEAYKMRLLNSERINGSFFEVQTATGRKGEQAASPGLLRKVTGASKSSRVFKDLRDDNELAGVFASVADLGRIICVNDQVNYKAAYVGTPFPFHQDAGFVVGAARKLLARNNGVNAVIALDPSHDCNGGFEVLGGTHRGGYVDLKGRYDTSKTHSGLSACVFDSSLQCIPFLLPGDAIVFDPMLAHGSGPNLSPLRRRLATLWYVAAGSNT